MEARCRECGWFVSEWSGHGNVSCILYIGAWPRPKVIKLRPIFYVKFCSYLMFTLTLYLYHWPGVNTIQYNIIQYNTMRSPLPQSKLEECCFLDKCIFSLIFSKEDSTKNSYIILTCSKVYVCPLLLHSKVFRKFNMGNVISIFRIENKCVHFSMKARQSAERNGIKRILECWNKSPAATRHPNRVESN